MMSIPPFSQRDPKWANLSLGTTGRTVGSDGCLLTALTSKLNYHGIICTPADVVKKMTIQPSGDTAWPDISAAFPSVYFHWRHSTTLEERGNVAYRLASTEALRRIYALLALGQPTLVRTVTQQGAGTGHWLLAVDGAGTDDLMVMDPWEGVLRTFSSKYGPVKDNLYAYADLIGSPNGTADNVPDGIKKGVIKSAGAALHATAMKEAYPQLIAKFL
jgi:hypothetical protein